MAINKVVLGENILLDVSDTTATEQDVANGKVFHKNDGTQALGISSASSYTKLAEKDLTYNTTNTSITKIEDWNVGSEVFTKYKMIYIRVRDKEDKRNNYFLGLDQFIINTNAGNNTLNNYNVSLKCTTSIDNNGTYVTNLSSGGSAYGIFVSSVNNDSTVTLSSRYNSTNSKTINGTYHIEVYALDWPNKKSIFE